MRRAPISQAVAEEEEINITPMLDVVFILLIFFIVTANFIKEPGLEVNRPDSETAEKCNSLSTRCRIVIRYSNETWTDYPVFPNVTWVGKSAPTSPPNGWICFPSIKQIASLVPELSVEWFELNSEILDAVLKIKENEWPVNPFSEKIEELVDPISNLDKILELIARWPLNNVSPVKV